MISPTTPLPVRRALLVHAHPERASFSSAQADVAHQQLQASGFEVERIDLYDEKWDPVLHRDQFIGESGYFKPQVEQMNAFSAGRLREPVQSHLNELLGADLLVLSFPLWWFSMPAIMKGWVDRVFVMGAAFGGAHGILAEGGLRGKQAMLLVSTGGGEASFVPNEYGDIDTFLFHIHRGMLEFVGYEVLPPVITYGPARLDAEARAAALRRVHTEISARAERG